MALLCRRWLCNRLADVEEHGDSTISFNDFADGLALKKRSTKLYAILSGVLRNRVKVWSEVVQHYLTP